jgi:hypothetical protein
MNQAQPVGESPFENNGYMFDRNYAILELRRLIAIFLSSKGFANLLTKFPGEGYDPFFKLIENEEAELFRLLLTVASIGRVRDDRFIQLSKQYENQGLNRPTIAETDCGTLIKDLTKPRVKCKLTLREAFNKIIHANNISCALRNEGRMNQYVAPNVFLMGELSGKKWKASLDILKFAKEYVIHADRDF